VTAFSPSPLRERLRERVHVFLEANGAGKENHDQNATGDKYYFTDGKLMSEKLQKESEAFRAAVK